MDRVKARKDAVVAESTGNVEKWLRGTPGVTVIEGHARFESPRVVRVGDRLLEAPEIFINTGGRPTRPKIEGLDGIDYLTSSGMMDIDSIPEHLVVLGGSYIGLEFAQMYRRFGSRVTVVEMAPRLVSREDPEVSLGLEAILAREGVNIRLNAKCLRVEKRGDGVAMHVSCEQEPREVAGSHLLLAVGRVPNTDDLGLDRAGVVYRCPGLHPGRRPVGHQRTRHLGAGRCQRPRRVHAHGLQRLRNRRREPARPGPAARVRPLSGLCAVHRSATGARGHDGIRSTGDGASDAQGHAGDGARGPRARARRDAGLHAGAGRRADEENRRRRAARDRGRRSHPLHHRRDGGRAALHGDQPRRAHPSDGFGVDPTLLQDLQPCSRRVNEGGLAPPAPTPAINCRSCGWWRCRRESADHPSRTSARR